MFMRVLGDAVGQKQSEQEDYLPEDDEHETASELTTESLIEEEIIR